jgi:hypothetical protein
LANLLSLNWYIYLIKLLLSGRSTLLYSIKNLLHTTGLSILNQIIGRLIARARKRHERNQNFTNVGDFLLFLYELINYVLESLAVMKTYNSNLASFTVCSSVIDIGIIIHYRKEKHQSWIQVYRSISPQFPIVTGTPHICIWAQLGVQLQTTCQ